MKILIEISRTKKNIPAIWEYSGRSFIQKVAFLDGENSPIFVNGGERLFIAKVGMYIVQRWKFPKEILILRVDRVRHSFVETSVVNRFFHNEWEKEGDAIKEILKEKEYFEE